MLPRYRKADIRYDDWMTHKLQRGRYESMVLDNEFMKLDIDSDVNVVFITPVGRYRRFYEEHFARIGLQREALPQVSSLSTPD